MAKSKFRMMRFEEDKLDYAGAFIMPPNHRVSVSIEVDETLRVGSSGFPGESDAGEADEGSVLNGISLWPWDLL